MNRTVFGESVVGASHVIQKAKCQDAIRLTTIDDCEIIAVADGHGSKSCPYSSSGSLMAVNTFTYLMKRLYASYKDDLSALHTYFNRDGKIKVAQAIDQEWKRRVRKAFSRTKETVPLTEDGSKDLKAIYKMYGTTLLGLFIAPTFAFVFQLGDGDVMLVNETSIEPLVSREKILGVETHSLSKEHSWEAAHTEVFHLESVSLPTMIMLSTDGMANSYVNDAEFEKTCRDYYDLIVEHGPEAIAENLQQWLKETTEHGCGDDITAAFAFLKE